MRRISIMTVAGVVAVAAAVAAQAQTPAPKYRYEQRIMADGPTGPPPLKKRIAVARFDDSAEVADSPFGTLDPDTQKKYHNDDINSPLAKDLAIIRNGFTERMVTALFATDRFVVVERRDIHKLLREQDFAKTSRTSRVGSVAQGEVLSAQYLVTGLVTLNDGEFADTTSDSDVELSVPVPGSRYRTTIGTGRAVPTDPGATDTSSATDSSGDRSLLKDVEFNCPRPNPRVPTKYALHLRVYDVSTSQIVSAVRVNADSQWCLVKAAVQRMIVQMDKFPWKSRVSRVDGDRIEVEGGRDVNMSFGYRLAHEPSERTTTDSQNRPSGAELSIVEIREVTSVARPAASGGAGDIRPGDWVVFFPSAAGPR